MCKFYGNVPKSYETITTKFLSMTFLHIKKYFLLCFLLAISSLAVAQSQKISGTVRSSSDNKLLPGVTIQVKGTTTGTTTNARGQYELSGVKPTDSLVFSSVGFKEKTVGVNNLSQINVSLSAGISSLNQLVVIGYGTAKKKDLTGSITRISMSDKINEANVNLMQALVGSAAGINMEQRGGASSNPTLSIRGKTSLSGSDMPLIVLDGAIYYGSVSDINPNDVASIDILKGASAAAVYGRRSANGVVIINTKKGKAGKPVFSLSMYTGFQDMTNNPVRVMNADEFATRLLDWHWEQDVYKWYATHPTSEKGRPERPDVTNRDTVASYLRTYEEKKNYLAGNEINWVDEVLRTAPMQNYNLSVGGSSENGISYYLSGSFSDIKGIQKNDQFKRTTLHSSLSNKVTDWLTLGLNATYSYRDNSGVPASLSAARVASPLADNHIGSRDYDIYLGGELYQPYPLVYTYIDNSDISTDLFAIGDIKLTIPWVKGLKYTLRYSHLHSTRNNDTYNSSRTPAGVNNNGYAVKNPSDSRTWSIDNIINYSRSFGDHQINSTLLFSRENRKGSSSTLAAEDFGIETLGFNDIGLGKFATVSSSAYEENSISYMARINYSYLSTYLFTATVRRDGYSGFSPNHKWATFPSVAVGWVATNEPFLKDRRLYLKLRASYGLNGNQGIGRYASFSQMGTRNYVYGTQQAVGIYPNTLGNKDLSWEKTNAFNLGFDFHFLKSRIAGSLDIYTSKTKDVLVQRQIPRASGYTSVWTNLGELDNKGIEFELNTINLKGSFHWESQFVFSLNRNKILKLYGNGNDKDIGNAWFVGEPISSIYDYHILGIWTEKELFNGNIYDGWYPGQFKYADLNNDGKIGPVYDREIIGYESPSYRFSINNSLSYKNFTLSIFINSIQGGKNYYLANNLSMINPIYEFSFRKNVSAINPYWRPDKPTKNTTGIYNLPPIRSGVYQSRSFVRIQDVSIAYSLPDKVLNKLSLQKAQVYLSSKNPYVWTKWQGWDPEIGPSDTPLMRNLILGLRLSF